MDKFDGFWCKIKWRGGIMPFNINNRRYTGSKQKITSWISNILDTECKGAKSFCDLFAGTGCVANSVIEKYKIFYINDFLFSNEIIYKAFFLKQDYDLTKIISFYNKYSELDASVIEPNYVSINYGGKYFEKNDALKIGYIRQDIEDNRNVLNEKEYCILLASLIYSFDRCANTVGHYEAYFKKAKLRSSFVYELIKPVITSSKDKRDVFITREDSNKLAKTIECDIVYIDPPYSSRQYSRFYHVIEVIVEWKHPKLYGAALKPEPENMSDYCSSKAIDAFTSLIGSLRCKYIVVSYNNTYNSKSNSSKNKMELNDIKSVLTLRGKTKEFSIEHSAFNAGKTDLKDHRELLFVTKVGA